MKTHKVKTSVTAEQVEAALKSILGDELFKTVKAQFDKHAAIVPAFPDLSNNAFTHFLKTQTDILENLSVPEYELTIKF